LEKAERDLKLLQNRNNSQSFAKESDLHQKNNELSNGDGHF
jgi:hypothetical protein